MEDRSSKEFILSSLEAVKDPEIPVVSVVDLGIVRDIRWESDRLVVDITPTYSGCPALKVMENDISTHLRSIGFQDVEVRVVHTPAWSTDWISEKGKKAMKEYGIAPPGKVVDEPLVLLTSKKASPLQCPFCNSLETVLKSEFGSTACKALHFCNSCHQPFEHFKAF